MCVCVGLCVCVSCLSCPTLCNSTDYSPLDSSVHWILQARILEWIAIPFSRGSSWLRDQIQVSWIAGRFFTVWATKKALHHIHGCWESTPFSGGAGPLWSVKTSSELFTARECWLHVLQEWWEQLSGIRDVIWEKGSGSFQCHILFYFILKANGSENEVFRDSPSLPESGQNILEEECSILPLRKSMFASPEISSLGFIWSTADKLCLCKTANKALQVMNWGLFKNLTCKQLLKCLFWKP